MNPHAVDGTHEKRDEPVPEPLMELESAAFRMEPSAERQRFGSSLWWAVSPTLGHNRATIILGLGLALLVAFVALREHVRIDQVARSSLLVLGSLLLVVSYVQPWHALWLLPFFAVVVAPGWLWLSGTLPLLYLFGLELPVWVRPVVYGPLAVWVVWKIFSVRRRPTVDHAGRNLA